MYDDIIAAVMQDIQADAATARAKALRGQQPPMPPPPGAAPQQPMPGPPPGAAPQQPMPGPPGAPTGPQNGPALPKTLGQGQKPPVGPPGPAPGPLPQAPPAQPPDAGPDLVGEEQRLRTQQQEALAQQQQSYAMPDRGASVEAFQRQQGQGANHLMLALAAQHAGPDFQPLQVHFLKRAAEASAPMRMAGGTMTETGFVEDPGYAQELDAKRADARVKQLDTALAGNLTAQERRRLEAEKMQHQTELRRMMGAIAIQTAGMASADRRYAADTSSADKRYTADSAAATAAAPAKATESERASAGYLGRMQAVEGDIDRLAKAGGQPSVLTKALGGGSVGRAVRPFAESASQQQYRAVQEDWVRAKLRKESGASIPTDEMEREIETYFPQPGETDPGVIAIKRQARAQAAEQLRTSAGRVEPTIAPKVGGAVPGARPPPPKPGDVVGGYTFKGGDPANPASWSK